MTEWARRIATARLKDFPSLLEETRELVDRDGEAIHRLLAARWAEFDPSVAWAAFKDKGCVGPALDAWLRRDRAGMLAALTAAAENEREGAGTMQWLQGHADCCWAITLQIRRPLNIMFGPRWEDLVHGHETEAEELAREWACRSNDSDTLEVTYNVFGVLAAGRAERDPHAALEWIATLENDCQSVAISAVLPLLDQEELKVACGMIALVARSCPRGAVLSPARYLSLTTAAYNFDSALTGAATRLGEIDPGSAIDWINALPPETGFTATAAASAISASLTGGRTSVGEALILADRADRARPAGGQVFEELWRLLPAAILTKAAERIVDSHADRAPTIKLDQLVSTWAQRDASAAVAFIAKLDPDRRSRLAGAYLSVRLHGRDDPDAVAAVLAELPIEWRGAAVAKYLRLQRDFRVRPWDASPCCDAVESIPDPEARKEATANLCVRWAMLAPRAAAEWTMRQGDPSIQQAGLRIVVEEWVASDAWSASRWLGEQPAGPGRDAGCQALATGIAEEDPDAAWQWASAIADRVMREDSLARIADVWSKTDPAAARAAVERASGLAPATRRQLLDGPSAGGRASWLSR